MLDRVLRVIGLLFVCNLFIPPLFEQRCTQDCLFRLVRNVTSEWSEFRHCVNLCRCETSAHAVRLALRISLEAGDELYQAYRDRLKVSTDTEPEDGWSDFARENCQPGTICGDFSGVLNLR